jgi:NAD(P)-dependent dehydrogenase (short-subunit alcohol dehydrogenase family)
MDISFTNKVALVTGAGSGLGLATAKAFAKAGAAVALADTDEAAIHAAADELTAQGMKALAIRTDVSDDAQVQAMVEQTVAAFGRFDRVTAVNLSGVWSCMKFELRQMREQGSGAIVNCSSIGGIVGGAGRATYHAAKYGVIGLTTSAALEYAAKGIRINAIFPGLFDTPMSDRMQAAGQTEALANMLEQVPIARLGRADEIADAVLWLCSDASSYVIGHALVVDGGYTIH